MAVSIAGRRSGRTTALLGAAAVVLLTVTSCGGSGGGSGAGNSGGGAQQQTITLYTCISDSTIQPVIKAFEDAHRQVHVNLFRAPTGQVNARVAADARSGGLRADVIWACDPLTQQAFVDQGLVGGWTPTDEAVPQQYRTADYVGAAVLYVVAVHRTGVPAPRAWSDLTGPAYGGKVAVPDPSVAASALGALGWFAAHPDYGIDFYATLKKQGAVQVSTPDDVTTGVAQGQYRAGITIATSAYAAKKDGSPVGVAWPQPGAVAIYEPLALAKNSATAGPAKEFITFAVSEAGQTVVASAGSYPAAPGVGGPTVPAGAPVVTPDWPAIAKNKDQILGEYQQVFGGG
jgi:iron(III) transport system substrate-binding protein